MKRLDLPQDAIAEVCRRYGIRRLAVFCSALQDEFSADSDVDLLVEFAPNATPGLQFFTIEDEFSRAIGRPVDLNTAGFLNKRFRDRVIAEAYVIYEAA